VAVTVSENAGRTCGASHHLLQVECADALVEHPLERLPRRDYYLLVLYVLVLLGRAGLLAVDRRGALRRAGDAFVHGIVHTGAAAVVLPIPLIASLYARPDWVMWFGIPTPDQSVIPQVASLIGYGTAVMFGWLVHRQPDLLAIWGRQWTLHLAGAATATAVCLSIAGVAPAFVPQGPGLEKFAFAVAYGVAIWTWSFGVIGLAIRFMSRANERVRYVADASYWIYLAHLPVVASLQVLVGHLPWHWSAKFPLVLAASLVILFASYRYLVRATFIRPDAQRAQASVDRCAIRLAASGGVAVKVSPP
jgi:peptidoglycan/LPS O-acetylase OafA/YrhL